MGSNVKLSSDVVVIIKNKNELWRWLEIIDRELKPEKIRIYDNGSRHVIIKIYEDGFVDVIR